MKKGTQIMMMMMINYDYNQIICEYHNHHPAHAGSAFLLCHGRIQNDYPQFTKYKKSPKALY